MLTERNLSCKVSWILFFALVLCLYADAAQAAATWGNLSIGKFYRFSAKPYAHYGDRWPVNINGTVLSDGVRLTDGITASQIRADSDWVGWYSRPVTVTIDLGQSYAVSHISLHACSQANAGVYYPRGVTLWTSTDGVHYQQYGIGLRFPRSTSYYSAYTAMDSRWVNARWIKYTVTPTANFMLIDEITVYGTIPNTPKMTPSNGCYQGAFPLDPNIYALNIADFETKAGKSIKMVLWYADWATAFQNSIGYIIDQSLGGRYIEVGWLPYYTTNSEIASGTHDIFLFNWFKDCAAKNYPIWLRPMNEMNGPWTWENNGGYLEYGGNPQYYKWAWRRMYNIAQKAGCTGEKQVFVWSPDLYQDSANPNTDFTLYYPGDQYTDWVGCSCYGSQGTSFLGHVSRWYNLYSNKTLMIAEGGAVESTTDPNWKGSVWMNDWFYDIQYWYPQIKAFVWFNTDVFRIDTSANSLSKYQSYIQNSYYLGN